MSYCLIKKGIELIDNDLESCLHSSSQINKCKKQLDLEKKQGKGILNKKKNQQLKGKFPQNFSQRKVQNCFEAYECVRDCDRTSDNLRYLQRIDAKLSFNADAEKVREHHLTRISKERKDLKSQSVRKSKKAEKTVFTEEDFEKMNDIWLSLK